MSIRVEAEFQHADQARDAVIDLERRGVTDAERVELVGFADPRDESTRRIADRQVAQSAGRRAAVGGAIGMVIGALIGAGMTLLLGIEPQPTAASGAAAGGALFIGALAGYYVLVARLPVTDGANEAVDPGPGQAVKLTRHLDDPRAAEAARSRPRKRRRFAPRTWLNPGTGNSPCRLAGLWRDGACRSKAG